MGNLTLEEIRTTVEVVFNKEGSGSPIIYFDPDVVKVSREDVSLIFQSSYLNLDDSYMTVVRGINNLIHAAATDRSILRKSRFTRALPRVVPLSTCPT